MVDKAVMESEKRRDSQLAKMAEKIVIDAMEMYAVEGQHETVQSPVSLVIQSVVGVVLDNEVVAGHMHRAAMRAAAHPAKINAAANDFLRTMIL